VLSSMHKQAQKRLKAPCLLVTKSSTPLGGGLRKDLGLVPKFISYTISTIKRAGHAKLPSLCALPIYELVTFLQRNRNEISYRGRKFCAKISGFQSGRGAL